MSLPDRSCAPCQVGADVTFDVYHSSHFAVSFPVDHVPTYAVAGSSLSLASLPPSRAGGWSTAPSRSLVWVVIIVVVVVVVVVPVTAVFVVLFLPWHETRLANRRRCRRNGGAGMASKERKEEAKRKASRSTPVYCTHTTSPALKASVSKVGACHRVKECVRENQYSLLREVYAGCLRDDRLVMPSQSQLRSNEWMKSAKRVV